MAEQSYDWALQTTKKNRILETIILRIFFIPHSLDHKHDIDNTCGRISVSKTRRNPQPATFTVQTAPRANCLFRIM